MNGPREWSSADDEIERLAQFIHLYFPLERGSLNPAATPRPKAVVNVTMKLLMQFFGTGGKWPVRYTVSGELRHYLDPRSPDEKPMTFCGHKAYTMAQLLKRGDYDHRRAEKLRHADECPRCKANQRTVIKVTDAEMADTARRLRELEAALDPEED